MLYETANKKDEPKTQLPTARNRKQEVELGFKGKGVKTSSGFQNDGFQSRTV